MPAPAAPFTVKVMGFNDYHGTLESPGTFGQSTAVPAASQMREALGPALPGAQPAAQGSPQPSGARPREPVDKIYAASLRSALQVITAP